MILSAHTESIILSVPPAESMILSALPERQWATPAAQWVAVWQSNHVGRQDGSGTMDSTMSSELDEVIFGTSDLCFFLLSQLPPNPDFHYRFGFS
jgi:hypothetical protein